MHMREQGVPSPRPRLGLRIGLETKEPGTVEIAPLPDHHLLVHFGSPARGFWESQDVFYTPGDIDMIPAGHSTEWEQIDRVTLLDVQLPPTLVRRAAQDIGLDPDRELEPNCHFRDPQIEHIAWALDAERRAGRPSGLLYTESLGMALAVRLLGPDMAPVTPERGLSKSQLRRVTDYIEDHLDQDLSLARLADVAGVSVSHLKTQFRRSTGLPVHQYVVQRRVERAKALLLRGDLPASQVAAEAGFAHQSHMALWMRRVLGVTPTSLVRSAR